MAADLESFRFSVPPATRHDARREDGRLLTRTPSRRWAGRRDWPVVARARQSGRRGGRSVRTSAPPDPLQ